MKHIVYNFDTGARDLTLSDCEPCTTGPINQIILSYIDFP